MEQLIATYWSKIRILLKKFEVDRSVVFGALNVGFGLVAAPITAYFMIRYFSPVIQGYYYTFSNMLALQFLFELGFCSVIIQFASHEWAQLSVDRDGCICGDPAAMARLKSLMKLSLRWYAVVGFLVMVGLSVGGIFFFAHADRYQVDWFWPWCVLCVLTGITLCFAPIWAVLEGCNQVAHVYWFRLVRTVLMRAVFWTAMFMGLNLWTVACVEAVTLLYSGVFLWRRYKNFIRSLLSLDCLHNGISWAREIWPMQWRIALSSASGYFVFFFFVPVLFQYHGPIVAGQMGMTWSIVSLLSALSMAWVSPKVPILGVLISQKKYEELDALFWRLTRVVFLLVSAFALILWLAVLILGHMHHPWAARFLPPLPTAIFLAAQVVTTGSFPASAYLRAHKKEPLLWVSLIAAIFIAISNLVLGKYFSALGMACGYWGISLVSIIAVFIIWNKCRKEWHTEKSMA